MNEKYDKHRKELLEEDFNKHRELTEPAKFHSQTVGSRGPVLEQDSVLHESLQQFIHEKILERPVHVKGFARSVIFKRYIRCLNIQIKFLQNSNEKVPVMVRFSLVVSTKGTPDTLLEMYAVFPQNFIQKEGIFDLLCNHIPVFLSVIQCVSLKRFKHYCLHLKIT